MKCIGALLLLFLVQGSFTSPVSTTESLIVSSSEAAKKDSPDEPDQQATSLLNPEIYSMQIQSNVSNRFATTLVTSKVRNLKNSSAETTFSLILPENAFISAFEMEIEGKVYKAYVKEKGEAKRIYEQAVSRGQSAAHVELSARDSKTFTTSVNIEPQSKTIFRLTYEELLQRQQGQYELVINLHPGQPVKDLGVEVSISESRPLTFVRTPSLRTGNEISKNDDKLDPSADVKIVNASSAVVKFNPDVSRQNTFAELLGSAKENGLAGQFVVQYDVERDPHGGEVLVSDGFFVHFFAPSDLQPLKKHVVFVLDHSGSMSGSKFEQLTEAMQHILSELKPEDVFHIVRFSSGASVWDIETNTFIKVKSGRTKYGNLKNELKEQYLPQAVQATAENVDKAKTVIKDNSEMYSTNIIEGLEVGVFLVKRHKKNGSRKHHPLIVFLTDGYPNEGIRERDQIVEIVTNLNKNQTAIFSLSFGSDADKTFLRKLSSKNLGFSRHIYAAGDASLQLQDFYRQISSLLLTNVTFKYTDKVTNVTHLHHPIFFNGSEIVVAGRIGGSGTVLDNVVATSSRGPFEFKTNQSESVTSLERLWAYLTVQQILKDKETAADVKGLEKKALDLALKYSFVTAVSSLVVVKPNDTVHSTRTENDETDNADNSGRRRLVPGVSSYSGQRNYGGAYQSLSISGRRGFRRGRGRHGLHHMRFGVSYDRFASPSFMPDIAAPPYFMPVIPPNPHLKHQVLTPTTRRTPIPSSRTSTTPQTPTIPQWLVDLKNSNETINTTSGSFKLGQSGGADMRPECPKTPFNLTGSCTIIFDCPEVLHLLKDVNVYLQYFCPLNEFAGVCCPNKQFTTPLATPA